MNRRSLAALACASALSACSGAANVPLTQSLPAPVAPAIAVPTRASVAPVRVSVRVIVRGGSPQRGRRAHFISPATDGVLAQVYGQDDPQHLHLLGESATDVSPGSAACGGEKGYPRSCTVTVPAPPGNDAFVFTTYDAAPDGKTFPKSAHVLGIGALAQRILANRANDLAIYIGGAISAIGGVPAFASLPGDGRHHAYGFVLQPEDFNDDPISAGAKDPYANPISLSLVETGSSGHATLSIDGGAGTTSIVSHHSSDRIALDYDGEGSAGYGIVVTISANGVSPQRLRISPLYVSGPSSFFTATQLSFYASAQQATLAITELDAPSTTAYTAVPSGCTGIASVGGVTGSGSSAQTIATSATAVSASGCTIAISDGSSTVTIDVTNTTTGGTITVPNVTIAEFPVPSASARVSQLAAGPDGAIWFTECNPSAGKIGRIPTDATPGSGAQISEYPIPTSGGAPLAIVAAPDGALWFTEQLAAALGRIPTDATPGSSAQITESPLGSPFFAPRALVVGPAGNLWITDQIAADAGVINLGGGVTQTIGLTATGRDEAVDAAGNVWIATDASGKLFSVAPNGTVSTIVVPAGSNVGGMAFDAAGNLWLADAGLGAIDELPSGATSIATFPVPDGGRAVQLAIGPDGAIWFTDDLRNVIGRMTPAGVFAPAAGYAIPTTASSPAQIINGPDGALWFAEFEGNAIARIVPTASSSRRRNSAARGIVAAGATQSGSVSARTIRL